jgi:transposase
MDASDHLRTVSALLDLDEFEGVDLEQDRRGKQNAIGVIPQAAAGLCPHGRGVCDERHPTRESRVMDLPMGGCRTELKVTRWPFHGRACDKFFTPRLAALAEGAHATERLLARLAELIQPCPWAQRRNGDMANAARFFGLAEKTAEKWYYEYGERNQKSPSDLRPIRSLGIDELS